MKKKNQINSQILHALHKEYEKNMTMTWKVQLMILNGEIKNNLSANTGKSGNILVGHLNTI